MTILPIIQSPLLGLSLTLLAYQGASLLFVKSKQFVLLNPVLVAVSAIIVFLNLMHISYQNYWQGAQIISFFNGSVVVALAIPLHQYAKEMKQCAVRILFVVCIAALVASLSGIVLAKLLSLDAVLVRSVAARSVTTPLAILITEIIHGNSGFITLFAILNGIISSMLVFPMTKLLKVKDEAVVGLTAGIAASAIGTAMAFNRSYRMGSYAALGMILNGLVSAILIPYLVVIIL